MALRRRIAGLRRTLRTNTLTTEPIRTRLTDTDQTASGGILLYCRTGFEKECATEIQQRMSRAGLAGYVKAKESSGYVLFCRYDAPPPARELPAPDFAV